MTFFRRNYQELTDEVLLTRSVGGDERAFAALYDRYGQRMHRYFHRMMWRDAEKAADLTQELFLKVLEKAHLFDVQLRFSTWLYAIAANMCKNEYRKNAAPAFSPDMEWYEGADIRIPEILDRPLFERHLQQAIDRLEAPQRTCFVLRYMENLSVRDISVVVDCPEGTVKSRLHHALKKVADEMAVWKNM